jgi:hypothetical protein
MSTTNDLGHNKYSKVNEEVTEGKDGAKSSAAENTQTQQLKINEVKTQDSAIKGTSS